MAKSKSTIIKSVQKSLKILKFIISSPTEVSLSELEKEFGYNQSTIHHLLKTLSLEGFVSQNPHTKRYDIGPELLNIWLRYRKGEDYFLRAYPVLKEIVSEVGETANLFIREGDEAICVTGEESYQLLKAHSIVGRKIPLHCTAAGKAFLAYLPEEEIRALYRGGLKKYMENTTTDLELLLEELKTVRERGYAKEFEEFEEMINALGFPVFNNKGEVIASVSLVAPNIRMGDEKMDEIGPYLLKMVGKIKERLFGREE